MSELEGVQEEHLLNLKQSIFDAKDIVTKNYLQELEDYEIKDLTEEEKDIDIVECGKFYRISKLILNKEENFLSKLITIVNVAFSIEATLATVIKSDGKNTDIYLGIVSKKYRLPNERDRRKREADAIAFRGALDGNLLGSDLVELSKTEVMKWKREYLEKPDSYYASISGIAGLRTSVEQDMNKYVQGIEKLVDALARQKYSIITISDPINTSEVQNIKQGYEILHTQLSGFLRSTVTYNEGDSLSLSETLSKNFSEGISEGITYTQSRTNSKGKYFAGSLGVSGSLGIMGTGVGISAGVYGGKNSSVADTRGQSDSSSKSWQKGHSEAKTKGSSKSSGKSLQLFFENKTIKVLLDKIDKQLARIEHCENYGAFDCATYVIADSREQAFLVAGNYNALMRGENSGLQFSHINSWYKQDKNRKIGDYLKSLVHPKFYKNKGIVVTPATISSGKEMALQMGLPTRSIQGISVVPMASFGRNPKQIADESKLSLGNLYYMGKENWSNSEGQVSIDTESLRGHCFVTGSTGAGKSTIIYSMLDQLMKRSVQQQSGKQVKFMVIEPAKGEYKNRFGSYPDVKIYGSNFKKMPLLRINPFAFPKEIHVLEHIERLIEIFNVCWPMYAAMPAVLKDALERAYQFTGWDLNQSECKYEQEHGICIYPTFEEVLNQIEEVMNASQYSADSKSDYKGALSTRIRSLTTGLYRQIFSSNALSDEELFEENVIIDLSRISSAETKALLMGFLIIKLQEYRMAKETLSNQPLRHITVLEEAHHLLRRVGNVSGEGSNIAGKSVEMLSNAIAEMRTYGESFWIVDQSPSMMDLSAIRNTNTKIILRLPDSTDRQLVGQAAGLNMAQIDELAKLHTFVAAIYQNDWLEPILCKFHHNFEAEKPYLFIPPKAKKTEERLLLTKYLLIPYQERAEVSEESLQKIKRIVMESDLSVSVKIRFLDYLQNQSKEKGQFLREQILGEVYSTVSLFGGHSIPQEKMESWMEMVKERIGTTERDFTSEEIQKLIAILLKNECNRGRIAESNEMFERFLIYLGEEKNGIV